MLLLYHATDFALPCFSFLMFILYDLPFVLHSTTAFSAVLLLQSISCKTSNQCRGSVSVSPCHPLATQPHSPDSQPPRPLASPNQPPRLKNHYSAIMYKLQLSTAQPSDQAPRQLKSRSSTKTATSSQRAHPGATRSCPTPFPTLAPRPLTAATRPPLQSLGPVGRGRDSSGAGRRCSQTEATAV